MADSLRAAARLRFLRTDEGAGDLSLDIGGDPFYVEPGVCQELAGIVDCIDAPRLDIDRAESGITEQPPVFVLVQRAGDAPDPQFHAAA